MKIKSLLHLQGFSDTPKKKFHKFIKLASVLKITSANGIYHSLRSCRSCEKTESSISGAMLNEFKRKDWGKEKNWRGGGGLFR